ncbi:hypothetical protein SAMD00023353_0200160 [Rosellinia necatrix]|uniref:Uncharacterized protein n=1 Tax=Rosellinia necatrix TaxID=77044 RepID=A0A1S7UKN0_ROSNE|nr:hypothetical protein SAMD00023353_0200160 [Rosellinia necatrix]
MFFTGESSSQLHREAALMIPRGQLLLKTSSIQIKGLDGRIATKPVIQRLLNLKNPPISKLAPEDDCGSSDRDSQSPEGYGQRQRMSQFPDLSRLIDNIDAHREKLERLDTAGYQIIASFNEAMQRIDEEVAKLRNEMIRITSDTSNNDTQIKGLAGNMLSVKTEIAEIKRMVESLPAQSQLKHDISSLRNTVTENNESLRFEFNNKWDKHQKKVNLFESKLETARRDLKEVQTQIESTRTSVEAALSASNTNTEEIAALKFELENLRRELALDQPHKSHSGNPIFASRELDILTRSITKIGHRANQVDTLQMEIELLKSRVEGMERQAATSQRDNAAGPQQRERHHPQLVGLKRKASPNYYTQDGVITSVSSLAMPNLRDVQASSPTAHPAALPYAEVSGVAPRADNPKRTKSGEVDKRTLRRKSKPATTATRLGKS